MSIYQLSLSQLIWNTRGNNTFFDAKYRQTLPTTTALSRNEKWLVQKKQVNELLDDDENKKIMKRRSVECETVFGQIKGNQHFRRFYLRSTEKVRVEIGLLLMGYNIKNLIRKEQEQKAA